MNKTLLAQALNALKYHTEQTRPIAQTAETIEALRAAIAAPEPEPLGYVVEHNVPPTSSYKWSFHPVAEGLSFYKDTALVITPVYTAPPDTEALRKELERVKGERDALSRKLSNMQIADEGHSHRCRACAVPYTPNAGENEDCPACGSDGKDIAAQGEE